LEEGTKSDGETKKQGEEKKDPFWASPRFKNEPERKNQFLEGKKTNSWKKKGKKHPSLQGETKSPKTAFGQLTRNCRGA